MAMSVMYNAGAQLSLGQLNKNISKAGKALAKVSSGMKINSAQDDSASFSISERMRSQIRSLLQDNQNVQNGSSMVRVAERGIDQIIQNIRTLKEKAIDAANDSNTDEDRATIQKEFNQLMSTIDDIAIGTQYNGKILLDGRYSGGQKIVTPGSATPGSVPGSGDNGNSGNSTVTPPNVPPLPAGYPFSKTVSAPSQSYYKQITNSNNQPITKGGIYAVADFTGTIQVDTTEAVKFFNGTIQVDEDTSEVKFNPSSPAQTLNDVQITGPADGGANIWIENLKVNNGDQSVIKFQGNNNTLSVAGENSFNNSGNSAVINVGGGLNVQGTGSIILNNSGSSGGAGIGSDASEKLTGNIVVSGANITANVHDGAAIGSGRSGSIGNIIIENATLDLHGNWNANIGSGGSSASAGNITIVHSKITSNNVDTGVGSGFPKSTCGNIDIYNSALDITNTYSACIGSGEGASCGNILVSNSVITGTSSVGACIGTGASNATVGDIKVINGTKVKHNCPDAAAIGSGKKGVVMGTIKYSNDIVIDYSKCYVHPDDVAHPGIGKGRNGTATVDSSIEPTKNSPDYVPPTNTPDYVSLTNKTVNRREALWVQHGTQANQRINFYINSMQTKDLKGKIPNEADAAQLEAWSGSPEKQAELQMLLDKAKDMTLNDARVTTVDNAKVAIRVVEGTLEYALDQATTMGAYLQRLEATDTNVTTMSENVQASESTIRDADMAKEMAEYTKFNILTQSSQAMLVQANQNSSSVLSLLG